MRRITPAANKSTKARPSIPASQARATRATYDAEALIEVAEDAAEGVERVFGPAGRGGLQEGPAGEQPGERAESSPNPRPAARSDRFRQARARPPAAGKAARTTAPIDGAEGHAEQRAERRHDERPGVCRREAQGLDD